MRLSLSFMAAAAALFSTAAPADAHESWISPQAYVVAPATRIVADIRVGEKFEGSTYPYLPQDYKRLDIAAGGGTTPVPGRMGDTPAITVAAPAPGLAVLIHVSKPETVTYYEWAKFTHFLGDKGLNGIAEAHLERGLAKKKIVERYSRYAKSLIAVGDRPADAAGQDRAMGLELEIVADANPYAGERTSLPVRVIYRGAPRAGTDIQIYRKTTDGTAEPTHITTDAEGLTEVPVSPGGTYLLNAVVIRPADPSGADGAAWETLWASLTFRVPRQ